MFSSKGIKDLKVNIKKIKGSSIDNNIIIQKLCLSRPISTFLLTNR